jgi:four helix bundle protein
VVGERIASYKQLDVFQRAMDLAMEIFETTRGFPKEEKYSLTDQVRRSTRSVCANISEAWRKRRYPAAFVSKLSDAETEASETQVWIEIARRCRYLPDSEASTLDATCDHVIGQIVKMIDGPEKWTFQRS